LISCSWLHLLKVWSLLKTRGDSSEKNAAAFIHQKLFKRIAAKCLVLGRDPRQLIKISTASNWKQFEDKTGKESLASLGHSCKWYFGHGRLDLDAWEADIVSEYGFGLDADMSWVNEQDPAGKAARYLEQVLGSQ
jgi:hypothetical protein